MCQVGCIHEDYWGDCTTSTRCIYETDEELLEDKYFNVVRNIDKGKFKEDLKNGLEVDGARLKQVESLRIK